MGVLGLGGSLPASNKYCHAPNGLKPMRAFGELDADGFRIKGSRKNNFTFYAPMHPAWLRFENSQSRPAGLLRFRALPSGRLNT